jgi:hypothetical protein
MKPALKNGDHSSVIPVYYVLILICQILLSAEAVLADTAERAYPIFRNIFPGSTRCNSVVRITYCRIIDITAYIAYILFHSTSSCDILGTPVNAGVIR